MSANLISTDDVAARMRGKIIRPQERLIQISRLQGSEQERDLQVPPNCGGLGRVRHFKSATSAGWPPNPLPILPACNALRLPPPAAMNAQVFQNNACAWRCWYCFVPYALLGGNERLGEWVSPEDLVARYLAESDRPLIIDLSGGSPDLTPEWVPWMMEALSAAGVENDVYLWSDDNLSTDYLFTELSEAHRQTMTTYANYGRVCCFKGFDEPSFSFNTKAEPAGFARQFEIFGRLIDLGLDLYGYATFTGPDPTAVAAGIPAFVDALQALAPNLPLCLVPLEISAFGPTRDRVRRDRRIPADQALAVQELAIAAWNAELVHRFSEAQRSQPITQVALRP
jgi:uncharacterized Fe-S cluster-containing radical SAM superfamily protein